MEKTGRQKRVALFVGVDDYEDISIHPLSCAVSDATALRDFFRERKEAQKLDRIELLANPTSDEVTDMFDELTASLGAGDFFLFYFAGHGMDNSGAQQLLCNNSKVRRGQLINAFPLKAVAESSKWHTAVVLDACRTSLAPTRAAAETEWKMQKRDLSFFNGLVDQYAAEESAGSLTVLCSCDENMSAGEVASKNHGLFTLAFLDVLRQADADHRRLDFDQSLSEAIGKAMQQIAREEHLGSNQRPWVKASGKPPVILRPNIDTDPLIRWLERLVSDGVITRGIQGECFKAIEGLSENRNGKSLSDLIQFFSNWQKERTREAEPRALAGSLIKAFCSTPDRIVYRDRPAPEAPAAPAAAQPARATGAPLTAEENDDLACFCAAVTASRDGLSAVRRARTDAQAIAALDRLCLGWSAEYGRKNALRPGVAAPLTLRIGPAGQSLASSIRRIPEADRTPLQAALLRAINIALSLGSSRG